MSTERIIEKIKKLFTLANNEGATVNEAANAMRMANKLLEKHNLNIASLAESAEETDGQFYTAAKTKWQRVIVSQVSYLYGCVAVLMGDIGKYVIVGKESDRVTAMIVIDSLIKVISKESRGKGAQFREGAVSAIVEQIQEILAARKTEEAIPGTGLVLADVLKTQMAKNSEWIGREFPNCATSRSSLNGNREGRQFGKNLSVSPRLSNKKALN